MRRYNEPISMEKRNSELSRFRWRSRVYSIESTIDVWVARTKWWATDERRLYFRVEVAQGSYEIYCRKGDWFMAGATD